MRRFGLFMSRRDRTARRAHERSLKKLVRDREKLAALEIGGSRERPMQVGSASVVEVRVRSLACPQCQGEYQVKEHTAPASGIRQVHVACRICGVARDLWFRIVSNEPN